MTYNRVGLILNVQLILDILRFWHLEIIKVRLVQSRSSNISFFFAILDDSKWKFENDITLLHFK